MHRAIPIFCLLSVVTTLTILVVVAIDVAVPPAGTVEYQFNPKSFFEAILVIYGLAFAPGVFLVALAPVHLIRFRRGQPPSIGFLIFSFVATSLSIFAYSALQSL
jgi:hypothetical protein